MHLSILTALSLATIGALAQGGVGPDQGLTGFTSDATTTVLGPTVVSVSGTSTVPIVSSTTIIVGTLDNSGSLQSGLSTATATIGSTEATTGGSTTGLLIASGGSTTILASTGDAARLAVAGPAAGEAWAAAAIGALAMALGLV